VKLVVVSLNVHVTIYVAHVTYVRALLVNVTVGALVSITTLLAALYALVFHNLSYDLTLHRYLVPFVNAVGVHDVLVHVHCCVILQKSPAVLN